MSPHQTSEAFTGTATHNDVGVGMPRRGETYRCSKCGMALQITEDCHCQEPDHVHFHCCGQEMEKV